jgi:hypothetical protein
LKLPIFLAHGFGLALAFFVASFSAHAASCLAPEQALREQTIRNLYPDLQLDFDVMRKGRRVGHHQTRFAFAPEGMQVHSTMELAIRILGIKVYGYRYISDEVWCGNELRSLIASEDKNGKVGIVTAQIGDDDRLQVSGPYGSFLAERRVLTSNHWSKDIVDRTQVLNTLTGQINQVRMVARGSETLVGPAAPIEADHYSYTGELEAEVWYDQSGHWVGLQFQAPDNTAITYHCRKCGTSNPSPQPAVK